MMPTYPPGAYIEPVRSRIAPGAVRIWADDTRAELLSGTCTTCRVLTPAVDLRRHSACPGGYVLECGACHAARCASYDATLERRSAQRARNRAAMHRYAARTHSEAQADRARLRPRGVKHCRKCGETLAFSAFSADITRSDGLNVACRACVDRNGNRAKAAVLMDERDNYRCAVCSGTAEHVDHKWPLALGGADVPENMVYLCAYHNESKGATPFFEWRPDLYELVKNWPCIIRPAA